MPAWDSESIAILVLTFQCLREVVVAVFNSVIRFADRIIKDKKTNFILNTSYWELISKESLFLSGAI